MPGASVQSVAGVNTRPPRQGAAQSQGGLQGGQASLGGVPHQPGPPGNHPHCSSPSCRRLLRREKEEGQDWAWTLKCKKKKGEPTRKLSSSQSLRIKSPCPPVQYIKLPQRGFGVPLPWGGCPGLWLAATGPAARFLSGSGEGAVSQPREKEGKEGCSLGWRSPQDSGLANRRGGVSRAFLENKMKKSNLAPGGHVSAGAGGGQKTEKLDGVTPKAFRAPATDTSRCSLLLGEGFRAFLPAPGRDVEAHTLLGGSGWLPRSSLRGIFQTLPFVTVTFRCGA